MWIIILIILGLLFWPKISSMFGNRSATQGAGTTMTTTNSTPVIVKPATTGPLANLLGSGLGSMVQTGTTTALSVPRAVFSSIFKR